MEISFFGILPFPSSAALFPISHKAFTLSLSHVMEGKVGGDEALDFFWPIEEDDSAINGGGSPLLPAVKNVQTPILQRQPQSLMSSFSSYLQGRILSDLKKVTFCCDVVKHDRDSNGFLLLADERI